MPYIKTWESPDIEIEYGGVTIHCGYEDEPVFLSEDSYPLKFGYAIYEPKNISEYTEPIEEFDIRELAPLVNRTVDPGSSRRPILEALIDGGFITQSGVVENPHAEPVDTLTMALPF
jgi:hypothetical protein